MAHLVSIAFTPADMERHPADHFARRPAERVTLVEEHGIDGDLKAGHGNRQVNFMLAEIVAGLRADGFRSAPGELGEQMVIAGLELADLEAGTRLRLGDVAVLEIVRPREPCGRFAKIQGKPMEIAVGRVGFMARVVHGGEVAIGATVRVEMIA